MTYEDKNPSPGIRRDLPLSGEAYDKYIKQLMDAGFERVERDDRLLDVFPEESREKGVELWSKIEGDEWVIIRLRVLPFNEKLTKRFVLDRRRLEEALMENKVFGQLEGF